MDPRWHAAKITTSIPPPPTIRPEPGQGRDQGRSPASSELLGRLGLPSPVRELARRRFDVVVVGAGHNGLSAAAYLARGGCSVLVVERRGQIGGACTLEQPFADPRWLVSPCAYLVGLLHPLVVDELGLARHGYRVLPVDPHLWCPFEDGTSLALWDDPERSGQEIRRIAPGDVEGYRRYSALFDRIRRALRAGYGEGPPRDLWIGDPPGREELEERLAGDAEALEVLLQASIAEVVEAHVDDERLRTALHGQGIIGTFAGPRDPGTASIHLLHASGILDDKPGAWGYVEGGTGQVSFALADAARAAGALIATGVEVAAVLPGVGVRLACGTVLRAERVVSNADPRRTLALCAEEAPDQIPPEFAQRVDRWRSESPVLKINCALSALPRFSAAADARSWQRAMVTISTGIDATQRAVDQARRGVPAPAWCELYFPTAYDPSVAPPGRHMMSVFAQYVPYRLAEGTWEERREAIADAAIAEIARFAPDISDRIEERQVLAPPDVEARIGITGGHIFHGECLPDQMWDRRFAPRTPIPGVYLCGAATHPAGSVIAIGGRNAATAVLADRRGVAAS